MENGELKKLDTIVHELKFHAARLARLKAAFNLMRSVADKMQAEAEKGVQDATLSLDHIYELIDTANRGG